MRLTDASGVTKDDLKVPDGELSQLILDAAGDEGKQSSKEICYSPLFAVFLIIVL